MLDSEEKTGLSFQLLASSVDHPSLALIGSSVRDAVGFTQLSVSRQLIFTVLNAKYVHPRPALLTDPFYKCNVITNVKNSCREITTTYLSAGHIESEAAGWKSGRLHCSLPRSDKSSSRSRLCWLRNNYYFPFASLRGNMTLSQADIITHHDVPQSEIKAMDFWRANHLNLIPYAAQLLEDQKCQSSLQSSSWLKP